jgi:hypothetical protein
MKVTQAIISAGTAIVIGVGGGAAVAQVGDNDHPAGGRSATGRGASASPTPTATSPSPSSSVTSPTAAATTPQPTPSATPADPLSEENLIRERLYYDVTGHSFSVVPLVNDPNERLGPCTGDTTFSDVLPGKGLKQLETILAGSDVLRVTELMAQTRSAVKARAAADDIVAMVERCPGIQGGDFGYGDPVVVQSDANRKVVYFAGYDSDRHYGGYIVFSVGTRVGVVSVADHVGAQKVAHLAMEAAGIAGI